MARLNDNYDKLTAGYLFPEIAKRTKAYKEAHPGVEVFRLGIGDTTEPLTPAVTAAMHAAVDKLSKSATYTGYGDEQGSKNLREAVAARYSKFGVSLDPSEVFISDGAKPDLANLPSIFHASNVIAVQDPVYPVYVDSNVIAGRTGKNSDGRYAGIVYMPCTEQNGFIPAVPKEKADLIYFCSPNNPTGAVATKEQLKAFVDYARRNKAVILFDAAYAAYISDPSLPRSIYEIPGAKECAIEVYSFSKDAGFTGVRLGWTVVPKELVTEDAAAGKANSLWNRRQCTMFNGASNIAQEGGLAALSPEGQKECSQLVSYYMENARLVKAGLESMGLKVFGGVNAPYLWMKTPNGMNSWNFFDKLLSEAHVVGTPGSGFGPCGEGYFRFSAFGHRENVQKAVASIKQNLRL